MCYACSRVCYHESLPPPIFCNMRLTGSDVSEIGNVCKIKKSSPCTFTVDFCIALPSQQSTTIRKFFDEIKLALRWDEKYNILEIIQNPGNDYWYHICLKLDLPKNQNRGCCEWRKLRKGPWYHRYSWQTLRENWQRLFQCAVPVTSIRVIKDGDVNGILDSPSLITWMLVTGTAHWSRLRKFSRDVCQGHLGLSLEPNKCNPALESIDWKMVGFHWSLVKEYDEAILRQAQGGTFFQHAQQQEISSNMGAVPAKHRQRRKLWFSGDGRCGANNFWLQLLPCFNYDAP